MAETFELSGWGELKERINRDIGRVEAAQERIERSVQDVRELIGSKIDAFRKEELEKLRGEQQREAERARKLAEDLEDKLSKLATQTAAQISALQVKAGVWGALAGGIPVAVMVLWQALKH